MFVVPPWVVPFVMFAGLVLACFCILAWRAFKHR